MTRAQRFNVELKIIEELRKRFTNEKSNVIVLNLKNGKNIEVKKLPTFNLSYERYEIVSLGYDYCKLNNKTYYGETEGLDGVAEIIMKIAR